MTSKIVVTAMSSDVIVNVSHLRAPGDPGPAAHEEPVLVKDGETYERNFWDGMVVSATETGTSSSRNASNSLEKKDIPEPVVSNTDGAPGQDPDTYAPGAQGGGDGVSNQQ